MHEMAEDLELAVYRLGKSDIVMPAKFQYSRRSYLPSSNLIRGVKNNYSSMITSCACEGDGQSNQAGGAQGKKKQKLVHEGKRCQQVESRSSLDR